MKRVVSFFKEKIGVTPSVAAPGDTNPTDATALVYSVDEFKQYETKQFVKFEINIHKHTLQYRIVASCAM